MRLHPPAMVAECLQWLRVESLSSGIIVDATLGTGAHTEAILTANPRLRVIGIDKDARSLEIARERLSAFNQCTTFVHGDYAEMDAHLETLGITHVDGVLMDLGISLYQLDQASRGFSFHHDGPLDMRLDPDDPTVPTAGELLAELSEEELTQLFRQFGEGSRRARSISRSIVRQRQRSPLTTTKQLVAAIVAATPAAQRHGRRHCATLPFMCLRYAVNKEIKTLVDGLEAAVRVLAVHAPVVTLTYESATDRVVKQAFRLLSGRRTDPLATPFLAKLETDPPQLAIQTRKPVSPTDQEIAENPRARSAKLRCAVRVAT